ncbi:MAG: type II secretion system protein GspD [Kiritimatiellia bacterium]
MKMKKMVLLGGLLALLDAGIAYGRPVDPTRPTEKMADRLKVRAADVSDVQLRALVVGRDGEGVALLGTPNEAARPIRKGARFTETVDGVPVTLRVRSITAKGVELETAAGAEPLFVSGTFQALSAPADMPPEFLRYLEATRVPLEQILRLISDQSGVNISASEQTAKKEVSVLLRNVTAATAVEEICRTTGLWFRRESGSDVLRVTTMEEYAQNLSSFREEKTESFTLLYPNVVEAASVIYGLYPERTMLSLGEEDLDEDAENDLSRRFRRFQMMADNGGSTFLQMDAPDANVASGGRGNGIFSYSRGGVAQRQNGQWDFLRRASRVQGLTASEAKKIDQAFIRADTNLYESVYGKATVQAANIFVTISRKTNMLFVRTSDATVMDAIRDLIRRIDVPTPMVLLEVKVLELNVTDDFDAGVKWTIRDFDAGLQDGAATHALGHDGGDLRNLVAKTLLASKTAVDPTMSFAVVSDHVKAEIEMMQKDGKAKVLATPTLLTANNEVSRIFSGSQYPLVTGWTKADTTTTDGVVVQGSPTVEIEKREIGDMLLITPNINADKTVTLRVLQENSLVDPTKSVSIPVNGGTGEERAIQYVESRSIVGTFVAKDGMTIMAGGLIKESDSETYWRTPVLGSMPLLGWLFRGTEKSKVRTELVVLIKPHVILTPMEGGKISEELMKALSAHPAADGRDSMGVHKPLKDHAPKDDVTAVVK